MNRSRPLKRTQLRRQSQAPRAKLDRALDRALKRACGIMAGYKCAWCGRRVEYRDADPHHVLGQGSHPGRKWDVLNVVWCHRYGCHAQLHAFPGRLLELLKAQNGPRWRYYEEHRYEHGDGPVGLAAMRKRLGELKSIKVRE